MTYCVKDKENSYFVCSRRNFEFGFSDTKNGDAYRSRVHAPQMKSTGLTYKPNEKSTIVNFVSQLFDRMLRLLKPFRHS